MRVWRLHNLTEQRWYAFRTKVEAIEMRDMERENSVPPPRLRLTKGTMTKEAFDALEFCE